MRASTLFAITLSVLLGLGAVATARYMGLFDKKEPPPVVVEKPTVLRVLAPLSNLYEGIAVTPEQVGIKEIRLSADEDKTYKADPNKYMAKYLTGTAAAAALRVPKRNIAADTPLLKEYFEEVALPDNVQKRLEPGTRAVNVAVPKKRAAGGGIWKDDYVEVWLTSKATLGSGKTATESLVSACVAKPCKVVMKRNNLWTVMAADPDDKPIDFTLQANPYRAALIEYAAARGELSLRPTEPPLNKGTGSFNDLNSPEYADEDTRVSQVTASSYTIGDKDLMRIFNLKPPPPPAPVPPPPAPIVTRRILGTELAGHALYDPNGGGALIPADPSKAPPPPPAPAGPPPAFSFSSPKAKGSSGAECEDCGK
jgi:Flp pilus assembly protein CpaB